MGYNYLEEICKKPWTKGEQRFIKKPSQVGMSELGIAAVLWMSDRSLPHWHGCGYVFPATKQLEDHLKARFFPIMEDPYFRSKQGNANLRFVNWNKKPIFFRGAQTTRDMKGWAADFIVMDEFDEWNNPMAAVVTMEARFGASDYSYLLGMSTPTIPDIGIDQAYGLSNQYNWYLECQKCYKDFSPLNEVKQTGFANCVVRDENRKAFFVCPHCKDYTLTNDVGGFWVRDTEKANNKHGYAVSRLFTARHNLDDILTTYEEGLNEQEFYNSVLGLEYAAENARLTRQSIADLCTGPEKHHGQATDPTWMGVDVGKKCHWVVGKPTENGTKQILAYGFCSFDELKLVAARYNAKYCVIDLRPYEQEVKKFIGGNRSYAACDFNSGHQENWYTLTNADAETSDKSIRIIKADKTQSCDILIREMMYKKSFILPGSAKHDNVFMNQMVAPVRMDKADKDTGDIKAFYGNGGRADHYFFAMVYFILSCQLKKGVSVRLSNLIF